MTVLTQEQIAELLKPQEKHTTQQHGPVRFFDKEMTCTNRGCRSSTYIRVQGVPRCMMHALVEANEMLFEAGFKGVM